MSTSKIVIFDSNDKEFTNKYGNTFEFVEPFLLDDNPKECVNEIGYSLNELKEAGFYITPRKIMVPAGVPLHIVSMRGPNMGFPQVRLKNVKFDLLCFPSDPVKVKVHI